MSSSRAHVDRPGAVVAGTPVHPQREWAAEHAADTRGYRSSDASQSVRLGQPDIKTLRAGLSEMTTRNRSSPHSAPNSRVARIPIRDIDVRSRMTLNVPSRLRHACEGRILPTVRRWAWVPRNPSPSSYLEPSGQPRTAETIREYGQLHDIHVRSHRTLNVRLHQLQPDVLPQPSQT